MERKLMSENFNKKLEEIKLRAEEEYRRLGKELDKTKEKAEWYVRYHPRKSMLYSLGTGIVIGMIISSIKRRRH